MFEEDRRCVAEQPSVAQWIHHGEDGTANDADTELIVQRMARVEHCNERAAWPQYPVDLRLRGMDVWDVVKHPVAENDVEKSVRPGDIERTTLLKVVVRQ